MLGKVVIADKSRTVRKMVEIALAKHPFELAFAEDGQAALDAVKQTGAIALIVDAGVPGVDGYEVTRQIKGDPNTRDAKVLLLVGRSARFDSARGRQSGVDGHLTKPFITQKLVQAVFTSLGQPVPDQGLFKSSMMNIPLARKPAEAAPEPAAAPEPPKAPAPPAAAKAPAPPKAPEPPKAPAPPQPPAARPQARKPAPEPAPPAAPPAAAVNAAVQAATDAIAAPAGNALAGAPREVIEAIAWQVIPQLAEAILKEEIAKVVRERMGA